MKANKRKRDLRRRSIYRLTAIVEGVLVGVTAWPYGKMVQTAPGIREQFPNGVRAELR